jgi:hypothetical protein
MPLGEFQENMHLGEGLPLKRNRRRIPHTSDLHPGLAGYVPQSVDCCVARGRDRINLRRAGALAGRLSSLTFGGCNTFFPAVRAVVRLRLRRRSLRCLERISISEGHVVIERTSPGGAALPYSGPRCSGFDSSGSSIQATASSHSSWDIAINGPKSRAIYRQPKGNVSEPRSSTRSMLPGTRSVSTPSRARRSRRDEPVIG